MKNLFLILFILVPVQLSAAPPSVLLLIDPDDQEMLEALGHENIESWEAPQDLNELQAHLQANRLPMDGRYQRLSDLAFKRQQRIVKLLDEFVKIKFDPTDPEGNLRLVQVVDEIVNLTFRAMSERDFYEILYVINQSWLDHLDQVERFAYLDEKLSKEDFRREERRMRIRKIATSLSTLGGAALGAYSGYLASQKIIPVVAHEKTISLLLKWSLGRTPIIIIGASVGAAAGSYIGFLGSNWMLSRQYTYVKPIDGNEDLRDILDIVDELP